MTIEDSLKQINDCIDEIDSNARQVKFDILNLPLCLYPKPPFEGGPCVAYRVHDIAVFIQKLCENMRKEVKKTV